MAIAAAGLLMLTANGPAWAKKADTGAAIQQQGDRSTIQPTGTVRATARKITNPIKRVYNPPAGYTVSISSTSRYIRCSWEYAIGPPFPPPNDFHVWMLKNSDRSWSYDLGRNQNHQDGRPGLYLRDWNIPEGTAVGTDYFFRIQYIPTGATSHSALFSVTE